MEAERTAEQEIQGGITAKEMKVKSSSRRPLPGGPAIRSSSKPRSSKDQDDIRSSGHPLSTNWLWGPCQAGDDIPC